MNVLVKVAVVLIIGLMSSLIEAQTNFEKGMTKAFELWQNGKTDEAENMFERIAKAEPEEWLPNYYVAQINSLKSWTEKDETVLKAQLGKAQEHLDAAMLKSEDNAELLIMQAQVYTNWVVFDGMTYGMKYGAKVSELYAKALELEPENPRAAFCKADWAMGSAKYFGQDTAPYCKEIEAAIELFDTFKPESAFHPNWGKERAVQVAESCK
ncbi:tetratricopeptide repeat protein [Winogradskyella pulchriflava]|uniref:Tetratricopeptide repeat protein n=1 Tax=Winogradskyella pulchriflava TaxID=1110688 RepID=A0ABV6QB14_9FLAO